MQKIWEKFICFCICVQFSSVVRLIQLLYLSLSGWWKTILLVVAEGKDVGKSGAFESIFSLNFIIKFLHKTFSHWVMPSAKRVHWKDLTDWIPSFEKNIPIFHTTSETLFFSCAIVFFSHKTRNKTSFPSLTPSLRPTPFFQIILLAVWSEGERRKFVWKFRKKRREEKMAPILLRGLRTVAMGRRVIYGDRIISLGGFAKYRQLDMSVRHTSGSSNLWHRTNQNVSIRELFPAKITLYCHIDWDSE